MASAATKNEIDTTYVVPPGDWLRVKAVMVDAADLGADERTRLVQARLEEPTLRTSVFSILKIYDKTKLILGPEGKARISATQVVQPTSISTSSDEGLIRVGEEYVSGRYRVLRPLGSGGMGQVFLAMDQMLQRHVALKTVVGQWLGSLTAEELLQREARNTAALSNHENIATLYDIAYIRNYALLLMEYVEGRTLAAEIAEGRIPFVRAVQLMQCICKAVIYAHAGKIVHCDLKPGNVQVQRDDEHGRARAKVLDFGLAHAVYDKHEFDSDKPNSQGLLVGTLPYMPPERLLTGTLNASGDIYSLGVTFFEMLVGSRPFPETNLATLTGAILGNTAPKVSSIVPECPARLDELVERALMKDPRQRYQTVHELKEDLDKVSAEIEISTTVTVPVSRAPLTRTEWLYARWRLLIVSAIAAIAGLTTAGLIASMFYNHSLDITTAF
jgi:serine/threonine protein kinase